MHCLQLRGSLVLLHCVIEVLLFSLPPPCTAIYAEDDLHLELADETSFDHNEAAFGGGDAATKRSTCNTTVARLLEVQRGQVFHQPLCSGKQRHRPGQQDGSHTYGCTASPLSVSKMG